MKIGIFWYVEKQVIGIAHFFQHTAADSLGLIDSQYTHIDYWQQLQQRMPQLQIWEYEDLPRGRVIYNCLSNKTMIYMDAKLFKQCIAHQITDFFQLDFESVVWKKDPHYRTAIHQIRRKK